MAVRTDIQNSPGKCLVQGGAMAKGSDNCLNVAANSAGFAKYACGYLASNLENPVGSNPLKSVRIERGGRGGSLHPARLCPDKCPVQDG